MASSALEKWLVKILASIREEKGYEVEFTSLDGDMTVVAMLMSGVGCTNTTVPMSPVPSRDPMRLKVLPCAIEANPPVPNRPEKLRDWK